MNIEGKKALTIEDGVLMNGSEPLRCPMQGWNCNNSCMGENCVCFKLDYNHQNDRYIAYCEGYARLIELGILIGKAEK